MKKLLAVTVCVLISLSMLFGCNKESESTVASTKAATASEGASKAVTIDNCKTKDYFKQFESEKYYLEVKSSIVGGDLINQVRKMAIDGDNMMMYIEISGKITHVIIKEGKIYNLIEDAYSCENFNEELHGMIPETFSVMSSAMTSELGTLIETGTKDGLYFETFKTDDSQVTYFYEDGKIKKSEEVDTTGTGTPTRINDTKFTTTIPSDAFNTIAGKIITNK